MFFAQHTNAKALSNIGSLVLVQLSSAAVADVRPGCVLCYLSTMSRLDVRSYRAARLCIECQTSQRLLQNHSLLCHLHWHQSLAFPKRWMCCREPAQLKYLGVLQHSLGVLAYRSSSTLLLVGFDPTDVFTSPETPLLQAMPACVQSFRAAAPTNMQHFLDCHVAVQPAYAALPP